MNEKMRDVFLGLTGFKYLGYNETFKFENCIPMEPNKLYLFKFEYFFL